jgi:hypothetical protein
MCLQRSVCSMQYVAYCMCVMIIVVPPERHSDFPYYHSAPCPTAFRHIPEMLYYKGILDNYRTIQGRA